MKIRYMNLIAAASLGAAFFAHAQAAPASAPQKQAPAATQQAKTPAPALQLSTPGKAPAPPPPVQFPPVDPKNFTATSPSVETVNAFLKQIWGYDPNRRWQVQSIETTEAPGVSNVVVMVAEDGVSRQPGQTALFVLPDGKHAIAGNQIMAFGADPFGDIRAKLNAGANGPSRGSDSKALELVEFADLQCPHCKEAQATVEHILQDFPTARLVFENFPLTSVHPAAEKAAEYGVCVAKTKGNAAFFQYVQAVFDNQAKLTPDATEATLKDAATKAGADPSAVKKCLEDPATKADVAASLKLGYDVKVNATPTLFVSGRAVPINALPYNTVKQLVAFAVNQK